MNNEETFHFTGEYIMLKDGKKCSIKDAQCVRIDSYCICHCMPGYDFVQDKCLISKITFLLDNYKM